GWRVPAVAAALLAAVGIGLVVWGNRPDPGPKAGADGGGTDPVPPTEAHVAPPPRAANRTAVVGLPAAPTIPTTAANDKVVAVRFLPGDRAASAAFNGTTLKQTVRTWDLATGLEHVAVRITYSLTDRFAFRAEGDYFARCLHDDLFLVDLK